MTSPLIVKAAHEGSTIVRVTPARMPASGSSSSIGASEPFATSAPESSNDRNAYAPSRSSGQKRSARSRSDGAWENCTEQATPSSAKRGRSAGSTHCACSIRGRSPRGAHSSFVAANASSASRFARVPIACTATGQPARAACRTISASSSPLVIRTPEPSSIHAVCDPSVPSMNTFR